MNRSHVQREIEIRHCVTLAEYDDCVRLEHLIWGEDVAVPSAIFVVARHTGGQVLGAFDPVAPGANGGPKMVGFTLALAAVRAGKLHLHSHMTAVLPEFHNRGMGRRLKLFQRQDALKRGIELIEWTFDPLDLKNAHFNLVRLGAVARAIYSELLWRHGKSVARAACRQTGWWRNGGSASERVKSILADDAKPMNDSAQRVAIPANFAESGTRDREAATRLQALARDQFQEWFAKGYVATGVESRVGATDYLLEPATTIDGLRLPALEGQLKDGMRLRKITLREIHLRLLSPFQTSFGTSDLRRILLLEAEVDGVIGWGESTAGENPFYSYETVETAWLILRDYLWPMLKGKEIGAASEVWDLLAPVRGHNMAKAALETAVWDAEAKQKNMPLAKFLGGTREEIPCGVSIGIQPTTAALISKVDEALSAGYQRIKIKIKPGLDIEPVRALRGRFPRIRLMADANSAYRLEDAPLLKQLDAYYLIMIEQPLGWDDIFSHAQLQRRIETPICLDECIHDVEHARAAIEIQACKIINIKLGRVGGHTSARRIHDLCQSEFHSRLVWRHA